MSNLDLFYSVKSELKENQKPFTSLNEVLLDSLDEVYPYVASKPTYLMDVSDIEMDNIQGDNYKEFLKNMKLFVKKLSARLDNEVKPISEKARLDLSYISNKDRKQYYPIVIDFEDGQYLIGLARQYGGETKTQAMNRSSKFKVTRWLLNGVDINKVIYNGVTPEKAVKLDKDVIMDTSILANKIAVLVQKNHIQWTKQHPNASINTDSELDSKISEVENEIAELEKQKEDLAKQLRVKKAETFTAEKEIEEPTPPEEPTTPNEPAEEPQEPEQVTNLKNKFNEWVEIGLNSNSYEDVGKAFRMLELIVTKLYREFSTTISKEAQDTMNKVEERYNALNKKREEELEKRKKKSENAKKRLIHLFHTIRLNEDDNERKKAFKSYMLLVDKIKNNPSDYEYMGEYTSDENVKEVENEMNKSQEDTEKSKLIELGQSILQTEDLDQIEEMLNKFEPLMNKKYSDDKDITDIYNQINEHLDKIAGV